MQWTVHGQRTLYHSQWMSLNLVDVEQPDGKRYEQHVVRMGRPVAGVIMTDDVGRALLMWRHRHVTGSWGWEIPAGRVDEHETPEQAAAREAEEETGWRPGPLRLIVASEPSNGSIDAVHYLYWADTAEHIGEPADQTEADRLEWVPLDEVGDRIAKGEIVSGPTLIAMLYVTSARK